MEISTELFWKMYNALRDAEGVLWSCDGATNPENETLTEEIVDTTEHISKVLDSCQKVIKKLKLKEEE
jgi:Zn-finger protein